MRFSDTRALAAIALLALGCAATGTAHAEDAMRQISPSIIALDAYAGETASAAEAASLAAVSPSIVTMVGEYGPVSGEIVADIGGEKQEDDHHASPMVIRGGLVSGAFASVASATASAGAETQDVASSAPSSPSGLRGHDGGTVTARPQSPQDNSEAAPPPSGASVLSAPR